MSNLLNTNYRGYFKKILPTIFLDTDNQFHHINDSEKSYSEETFLVLFNPAFTNLCDQVTFSFLGTYLIDKPKDIGKLGMVISECQLSFM